MKSITTFIILITVCNIGLAQKKISPNPILLLKEQAAVNIQSNYETYKKVALDIWNYAESGFKEIDSIPSSTKN